MRAARRSPSPIPATWPWPAWSSRTAPATKGLEPNPYPAKRPNPRGFDILKALVLSRLPKEQIAKPERDSVVATQGGHLGPGGRCNSYFSNISHVRIDGRPVCAQADVAHLY